MTGFDARADVPHFVYELIDATGTHLYVGCTVNLSQRIGQHAAGRDWMNKVVRVEASRYPDRESALKVERELIELYQPSNNAVYTDEYGPAGWNRRRVLMAEAHEAGRLCRDRACKAGCRATYHARGHQCSKGAWGGSSGGCGTCAAFMPRMICEAGEAEITAWQEIARLRGGQYANDLIGYTDSAADALAIVNGGLGTAALDRMSDADLAAWLDEQRDSA